MTVLSKYLTETEPLWVLGMLRPDKLPEWAASVLSAGIETEDILQLAVCSPNDHDCIRSLFEKILRSEGTEKMTIVDALKRYAAQVSRSILSENMSPREGARLIWDATLKARLPGFHELDPFIYAASEMDDRPLDKALFERAIRAEAKRWVESMG